MKKDRSEWFGVVWCGGVKVTNLKDFNDEF
jgi:hypothetical protein